MSNQFSTLRITPNASPLPVSVIRTSLIGDDDISVVKAWLVEFQGSETTQRAYRKEADRFMRWVHSVRCKTLADIDRLDLELYRGFMTNPPASWCGHRQGERGTDSWRPFEGPISEGSQRYALIVLSSLFSYLVQGGYLRANPAALIRRKGIRRGNNPHKTIPKTEMTEFLTHLTQLADQAKGTQLWLAAERELFVVTWLYWTGCRRDELAVATYADLLSGGGKTGQGIRWRIFGKGNKESWIPLRNEAEAALRRYSRAHGQLSSPSLPLLLALDGRVGNLCADQVRDCVKSSAAKFALAKPEYADRFNQVSPHWLRHAITAHLLDDRVDPRFVQRYLRHAYISTTMVYDSTGDRAFENAVS